MARYYKSSPNPVYDPYIKSVQEKLNAIRVRYHGNWDCLIVDGKYGEKSGDAVKAFQVYKKITPAKGELGPTTSRYIDELYNTVPKLTSATTNSTSTHIQQDDELMNNIQTYFIKPAADMVVNFLLSVQKDYLNNIKRLVSDWNAMVNRMRTKLLQLIAQFDKNRNSAVKQIESYWEKSKKLSPNRNNKLKKYSNNIDNLLDKHLGGSKAKLDFNRVYNQLKVGKVISGAGKQYGNIELYRSLWEIENDLNTMDSTQFWLNKWTKDINRLIDVLIGIVVGVVVALLLPEEMALIVVCLIIGVVGVLVDWLLNWIHGTYIGGIIDKKIGEKTAEFVRNWQMEMNDIKIKNKMAEEAWINSQDYITIKLFK